MKVAVIGYGIEGKAAAAYYTNKGNQVTVCDQDPHIIVPAGTATQLGPKYLSNLDTFDVIVRSAGINPKIILTASPNSGQKITTIINEFLRVCPTKNVIGVTGTKGKGTTATLIAKILQATGKDVHLGGNIGVSPLEFLSKLTSDSWVVLELSSFQLCDIQYGSHIAVCLMVVPEHLNWHEDTDDYIQAKTQLFSHQSTHDIAIYYAGNELSQRIATASPGSKITYFAAPGALVQDNVITIDNQRICAVNELRLLGQHNWQNICAAVTAVWQVTQDVSAIRSVLTTFSGLEHRLEFIKEIDGVKYYDDSFGTTPETAIVAVQAFEQPKVVIMGGSDKGTSFDELAKAVTTANVRSVVLIGETGPKIEAALQGAGFHDIVKGDNTMPDIVQHARSIAKPGDIILLSPACASYDMFHDYKDRAKQFQDVVNALAPA